MTRNVRPTQENQGIAMSRRTRVPGDRNQNIYTRPNGVFEVGFKDGTGKQRWRTVPNKGGIQAARILRDELLAQRGRGEKIATNPRLRFGVAADQWLDGPVQDLRPSTQAAYRYAIDGHARPRFETRRLDAITADDLARMVREMRAGGSSEWTIAGVLGNVNRIYKYSARRLGWSGENPAALLLTSERPKVNDSPRRRFFTADEIRDVLRAAKEPWKTMFTVTGSTGARLSEVAGLTWGDVDLVDVAKANLFFGAQVDRKGVRRAMKTDDSSRTLAISEGIARLLVKHKLASPHTAPADFVFCTKSGRAISQRNIARALRVAQRAATTPDGSWTFPVLHETTLDARGRKVPVEVPRGTVPSMHSFRHSFASLSLAAGDSIDEVAHLLGHRDGTVTRQVYVHEVNDARRQAQRRSKMAERFGSLMEAPEVPAALPEAASSGGNVRSLRGVSG